jgi:hypothetical protein
MLRDRLHLGGFSLIAHYLIQPPVPYLSLPLFSPPLLSCPLCSPTDQLCYLLSSALSPPKSNHSRSSCLHATT